MKRLPTRKLIDEMMLQHPRFEKVKDFKKGYLYHWLSEMGMHHFILISSSQKYLYYEVDLASNLLGKFDNRYGGNLARTSCRLPNLREQSYALTQKQAYYVHDGTIGAAKETLGQIALEINMNAIPWFEKNQLNLHNGSTLQHGVDWINENLDRISSDIDKQIEEALIKVDYSTIKVEHQLLDELKNSLRKHASTIDATKKERQTIITLGIDLLLYGKYIKNAANQRLE